MNDEQRSALENLAASRDRGEADRARAVLLMLNGWTSARIAEAFGVREDTVRLWHSDFMRRGIEALKASVAPGPEPVKTRRAKQPADSTYDWREIGEQATPSALINWESSLL